jgi:hypothetical protein
MADTWFRFYNDAVIDPKVQRLSGDMFKMWVNILCLASKFGGALKKDDLKYSLRLSDTETQEILNFFIERNLLDDMGDIVMPHNWDGRQYKSDNSDPTNAQRQKRYRDSKSNGTVTDDRNGSNAVTITATEQSRTDTDTDKKKEIVAKKVRDAYPEDFEKFWKGYPTTPVMSKKQAWAEWQKLEPDDRAAALAAVFPFREWLAKQKDHPVVHACRFLSQRRFDGFKPTLEVVKNTIFVPGDSEAFAAWERHLGKRLPRNKDAGWHFESEYPPGHERAA